jgi:stage V sporulation protein S
VGLFLRESLSEGAPRCRAWAFLPNEQALTEKCKICAWIQKELPLQWETSAPCDGVSLSINIHSRRRAVRKILRRITLRNGENMVDIIKVSARSRSTAVAGAIAGVVREHNRAEIQAIGAGAVNQAIKAAAIARGYLADDGIDVICIPYFTEVTIEEQERTALRLIVEPRIIANS